MVTPAPKPPFRTPNDETSPNPGNGWTLAIVIGVIVLLIYAVSQCSGTSTGNASSAAYNTANADMSNSIAAQTPRPVEPLSAPAVTRGTAHLRTAVTAEGFSGAMIYSQNCYEALAHQFTWAKLDTCGAFDMLAVRSIATADTAGLIHEPGYFESEAAAGRYLAAATGAGETGAEADARLNQLQTRTARVRAASPRPLPARDESNSVAASGNLIDLPLDDGADDDVVDE